MHKSAVKFFKFTFLFQIQSVAVPLHPTPVAVLLPSVALCLQLHSRTNRLLQLMWMFLTNTVLLVITERKFRRNTFKFHFSCSRSLSSFKLHVGFHSNLPGFRVERISRGADPNSTARGLAPILASPMISPSPSTVNTIFSFARRRTFPLSSVTSATTTMKSDPSATRFTFEYLHTSEVW